jgi:prepilin-type N-terminal cleavage/methylation domain-containing protein/prepilin-type processing-associated H-X9-DG protein
MKPRPPMAVAGQRVSAFTLVELMVVAAIIAVLASLLLPALARGKSAARKTACLSRLNQWNLALTLYAHDNEDFIPRESFIPGSTTINLWAQVRNPLAADVWYNALPTFVDVRRASAYAPSAARPEFYQRDIFFHCPSASFPKGAAMDEVAYFSYAMNSKLILKPAAATKLTTIQEPSATVVFLENRLPTEPKIDPGQENDHLGQPSAFATRFVARHNNQGSLAFADGHVAPLPGPEVVAHGKAIFPQTNIVWTSNPSLNPNIVD